jgi:hypothetical protein
MPYFKDTLTEEELHCQEELHQLADIAHWMNTNQRPETKLYLELRTIKWKLNDCCQRMKFRWWHLSELWLRFIRLSESCDVVIRTVRSCDFPSRMCRHNDILFSTCQKYPYSFETIKYIFLKLLYCFYIGFIYSVNQIYCVC